MILGVNAYLVLNGNGQEAVKFYEYALDAKVESLQTFGQVPENPEYPIPAEAKERVLHAKLKIADTDLMISDTLPGQPYETGSQVNISVTTNNVEKSKEVFEKLQEGGYVIMPLQETFWSPSYGQLTDKFGIHWQVSTHVEQS
ncbi:VOC family protein [Ectobacillus sp. JY-23]|uniref:VOC family protein n=1 Tax=Ectobacillus sp. JY-23 TaxID=2933872 RepID=UPI001FF242B7|nr:VOC family protein [Ectobacillus sp. JY-23]UOY91586.1 VOC family protein [Ectobacillus sp. JY-23]